MLELVHCTVLYSKQEVVGTSSCLHAAGCLGFLLNRLLHALPADNETLRHFGKSVLGERRQSSNG